MGNRKLNMAKKRKNDEFYTQMIDIQKEICNYAELFRDQIVFCNCDDPEHSCFWQYFISEYEHLKLKKLISTYLSSDGQGYKTEYYGFGKMVKSKLRGDGDFRSKECIEILKAADIVVTNPPFSLFREFVSQLIRYEKKFLIIGPMSAVSYKDFFPLLKENKVRVGYGFNKTFHFRIPDMNVLPANGYMKDGKKYVKMSAVCWFTNFYQEKQKDELKLDKRYLPEKYQKFDNFDAINVRRISEIPKDYYGLMGVPITFAGKYCPEQFEIIALLTDSYGKGLVQGKPTYVDEKHKRSVCGVVDGKRQFAKIIIRRKRKDSDDFREKN